MRLALVMLVASFGILVLINGLTWRAQRRHIPTIRKRPPPTELQPVPAAITHTKDKAS